MINNNMLTYYLMYKTMNLINGKIYIGVHSTTDINDGYLGSGKHLKRAIKKYGITNFKREVLQFFESIDLMYEMEAKIVNDDFIKREDTYNMKIGGQGGWKHVNATMSAEQRCAISKLGGSSVNNPRFHGKKHTDHTKDKLSKLQTENPSYSFLGKRHTDKTKEIIGIKNRERQKGERSSQRGTCWITNGNANKKIKLGDLDDYIIDGWVRGRSMLAGKHK